MIILLDANTLGDLDLSGPEKWGEFKVYQKTSVEQVVKRCEDAQVVITNKVKFTKEVLEQLPELKCIIVTATGINNVDMDSCKKRGIVVKNAAGYSTNSVVTHTFSMLFHFLHNSSQYQKFTQQKNWIGHDSFSFFQNFHELSALHWGVIGLGTIGSKVAEIAKSFGCNVSYYSTSGKNLDRGFHHLELNDLLKTCDVVSIHAPLNEDTKNLIGLKELELLPKGSVLLNLGRGGIINERALCDFLATNQDVSIGIDVIENEPMVESSPLVNALANDNFLCTPHLAWASVEAREKLWSITLENLKIFFEEVH